MNSVRLLLYNKTNHCNANKQFFTNVLALHNSTYSYRELDLKGSHIFVQEIMRHPVLKYSSINYYN